LLDARLNGIFQTHHVAGLGGRGWGRPRPLLYTRAALDPSARSFAAADPVWCMTAPQLLERLPDDFAQTLARVPHIVPVGRPYLDATDLHPEHPACGDEPPQRRASQALPPPAPDIAWYKWRGDEYVGHDWRNPLAAARHHKRQQKLARARERQRAHLRDHPASNARGSLQFRGWRWLCPRCGRKVNLLYLPVGMELPALSDLPSAIRELIAESRPVNALSFGCERCTRIKRISRCDPNAWNEIVTYLSGGHLYGREVNRPQWFTETRKIEYTPRPRRAPSTRRPQIEALLLSGISFRQIASKLKLVYGTVLWHAQQIYKQHGVRTLPELLRKHGQTPKLKKREEVRQRLARGESVAQIAREMRITRSSVYNHAYMLRRDGAIAKRRRRIRQPVVLCTTAN
jgi:DNA-binding NarL/FixJ family response regulator